MSSIIHRRNGHRWIQFVCGPKRHTLRLGGVTQRAAESVQRYVDSILCSKRLNLPLEPDCRAWLAGLEPETVTRLAELGLISRAPTISLGQMMDRYLEQVQVKSSTRITYERACKDLLNRFGRDRVLGLVSSGDARGFSEWLSGQAENPRRPALSPASVSGRLAQSANMFGWAVRQGWISENPFQGIARPPQTNPDRLQFVSQEVVRQVIRHCDPDTGLVLVLARWGGLRVPSEVDGLRWRDIDRDRETMTVRSIKTERHQPTRTVPLFPMLARVPCGFLLACPGGIGAGGSSISNTARATSASIRCAYSRPVSARGRGYSRT